MPFFVFFVSFLLLLPSVQAQDTVAVRDDYALAVLEAQAGKKVFLGLFKTKDLELPSKMDPALVENLLGLLCDNCHLTRFPEGLEDCPNLGVVEVNWYLFGEAPDNSAFLKQIFQVPNLTHLTIHGFEVPAAPFASKQLQGLQWTKGKLTQIPDFVFEQTQLNKLRLGCNAIKRVDERLGQLTQLEVLSFDGGACGGNPLEQLPASTAQLKNLRVFELANGQLATFPSVLWQLPKLERLHLHYPGLVTIADDIPKDAALRSMVLRTGRDFEGFPPSFEQLKLDKLEVHVGRPHCEMIQSQAMLARMKASIKAYEVELDATSFPLYEEDGHASQQLVGIWKAPQPFFLSPLAPKKTKGQYLVIKGSTLYLTNSLEDYPAPEADYQDFYIHEKVYSLGTVQDLSHGYGGLCFYGAMEVPSTRSILEEPSQHLLSFSYEYKEAQQLLLLTLPTGQRVQLTKVR